MRKKTMSLPSKIERKEKLALTVQMSIDPSPSRNEDIVRVNRHILEASARYPDIYLLRSTKNQRKQVAYVLSWGESVIVRGPGVGVVVVMESRSSMNQVQGYTISLKTYRRFRYHFRKYPLLLKASSVF
jgi:hypothetical protein